MIFVTCAPFYLLSSVYDTLHAIHTDNMYIIGGVKWCEVTVKGGSIHKLDTVHLAVVGTKMSAL